MDENIPYFLIYISFSSLGFKGAKKRTLS